jgi:hypothetical protein
MMNIWKVVAQLRSELELVEASIQAFGPLAKGRPSKEMFLEGDVRRPNERNRPNLDRRNGDGMAFRKAHGAV